MNEEVFITKFIKAYFDSIAGSISTEDHKALLKSLTDLFKTTHAVAEFLEENRYELVKRVHDTFYSSLTDEEKLEWALLT